MRFIKFPHIKRFVFGNLEVHSIFFSENNQHYRLVSLFLALVCDKLFATWVRGSVVERFPDKKEVPGSIPGAPTSI